MLEMRRIPVSDLAELAGVFDVALRQVEWVTASIAVVERQGRPLRDYQVPIIQLDFVITTLQSYASAFPTAHLEAVGELTDLARFTLERFRTGPLTDREAARHWWLEFQRRMFRVRGFYQQLRIAAGLTTAY